VEARGDVGLTAELLGRLLPADRRHDDGAHAAMLLMAAALTKYIAAPAAAQE
jgi:hypothetical protein